MGAWMDQGTAGAIPGGMQDTDADGSRELQPQRVVSDERGWFGDVCEKVSDTNGVAVEISNTFSARFSDSAGGGAVNECTWQRPIDYASSENGGRDGWGIEPGVGRMAAGVPHRVDRLKALGNAQVPLCAATAWRILMSDFE